MLVAWFSGLPARPQRPVENSHPSVYRRLPAQNPAAPQPRSGTETDTEQLTAGTGPAVGLAFSASDAFAEA